MLTEADLDQVFESLPPRLRNQEKIIDCVLKKIAHCPICTELFPSPGEIQEHLRTIHADGIGCSRTETVESHRVKAGDGKIYICPHCHFAVGEGGYDSATSIISNHVQRCAMNPTRLSGPARVSLSLSEDPVLIAAYLGECAEIEVFRCEQCSHCFGSAEALARHFGMEHCAASRENLTDEQLGQLRLAAKRLLAKQSVPSASPAVVRIQEAETVRPAHTVVDETPRSGPAPHGYEVKPAPSTPRPSNPSLVGQVFTRKVGPDNIEGGYIILPSRLADCLPSAKRITVHLAGDDVTSVLPYAPVDRRLGELTDWFHNAGAEPGDIVKFRLLAADPPEIRMWTEWEKGLSALVQCPPEDLKWADLSIRDCLVRVFADHPGPMHYRVLYAYVSKHRELAIGSVLATLSKYRGVLFVHRGQGLWSRQDGDPDAIRTLLRSGGLARTGVEAAGGMKPSIWSVVARIEEGDIVYNLLKRTGDSLSFAEICQKIAEAWSLDWHELADTGFINIEDERLKRLPNGRFALREWFDEAVPPLFSPESIAGDLTVEEKQAQVAQAETPPEPSPNDEDGSTSIPTQEGDDGVLVPEVEGVPEGEPQDAGIASDMKEAEIPSTPHADAWYLRTRGGLVVGPVAFGTLVEWAQDSCLGPEDAVSENMLHWTAASAVPDLATFWRVPVSCPSVGIPSGWTAVDAAGLHPPQSIAAQAEPPVPRKKRDILPKVWRSVCQMLLSILGRVRRRPHD